MLRLRVRLASLVRIGLHLSIGNQGKMSEGVFKGKCPTSVRATDLELLQYLAVRPMPSISRLLRRRGRRSARFINVSRDGERRQRKDTPTSSLHLFRRSAMTDKLVTPNYMIDFPDFRGLHFNTRFHIS